MGSAAGLSRIAEAEGSGEAATSKQLVVFLLSFLSQLFTHLPIMSDSKISLEGKVAIVTGAGNGLGRA